jgi:hypothetical protein
MKNNDMRQVQHKNWQFCRIIGQVRIKHGRKAVGGVRTKKKKPYICNDDIKL